MNKILENKYVHLISRILIGLVFVIFGASKIDDTLGFAKDISNYDILPFFLVNATAIILPWIELVAGILLICGVKIRANALLITAMLIVFNLAIIIAMARGLNIDCGCYATIAEQKVGWRKLIENFGLIALLTMMFFKTNYSFTLEKENIND